MGRRVHLGALTGAVLLALLGAGAAREAHALGLWRGRAPGEGLYPLAAALAVAACALAFAREAFAAPDDPPDPDGEAAPPARGRIAVYLIGLVLFAAGLEPLGYALVTAGVLALILRLGEGLSWRLTLAVTLSTLLLTHLVFERLLGLPLPAPPFG